MSEVTVVIPNYKGKKYLCACVDSLFKSTKMELSVIIVDNASEDGSIDEVKQLYPQVRCIMLDKNYGFCRAVNIGIKEADTPFVFLLNNDTLVCKGAVDALLAAIRQDDGIPFLCFRSMRSRRKSNCWLLMFGRKKVSFCWERIPW